MKKQMMLANNVKWVMAILILFVGVSTGKAVMPEEWENPQLTGVNNLPPHTTMVICPDAATAKQIQFNVNSERIKSSFYESLNGNWKYHYSSNHLARIAGFWETDFDDADWENIIV